MSSDFLSLSSLKQSYGTAWVFPGQGSQEVGMGRDVCAGYAGARALFTRADEILGYSLSSLCFEGPDDELRQTVHAQPAIFVTSLACLAAAIESGALRDRPQFMAGHSLGEYTALVAARALEYENGLLLVRERGRLMQAAGDTHPGTMAAIMRLPSATVEEICLQAGAEMCNYNSPQQIVIGGSRQAVDSAIALAKDAGGRAVPLNVSGAFHTTLMAPAAALLSTAIDKTPISSPTTPVIANTDAQALTSAEAVRQELKRQLTSPVLWQQTVESMADSGVTSIVEIGPGQALAGLIKRIREGIRTCGVNELSNAQTGER